MALLALVLQLGLSFGHVHHGFHDEAPAAVADTGGGVSVPSPSGGGTNHHDEGNCAIYAILALLAGAQTATAPIVALPAILIAAAGIAAAGDPIRAGAPRTAFRSRAPPQS